MNKIFSHITAFHFSIIALTTPLCADNNNNVTSHEAQKPEISETKITLIKELNDLSINNMMSNPENILHYFINPIESEFKALGFLTTPFEQTIKKAIESNQPDQNIVKLIKEFALNATLDLFNTHFTEEELKEVLDVYKNPLFQKHAKFLGSGWFAPLIDVLKDPKLFQFYETKITQFIQLIKDENTRKKTNELIETATKELMVLESFIKLNAASLKEKFKTQFPSIAPFAAPLFNQAQ